MKRWLIFGLGLGVLATFAACSSTDADPAASSPDGGDGGPIVSPDGGGEGGVTTPACIEAAGGDTASTRKLEGGAGTATVSVEGTGCRRTFSLASTADRRDNLPESPRPIVEIEGRPSLQTKNDLFDALYQLALDEAKENSVDSIKDGAFRNGAPLACAEGGCFETGRKWSYVWTRDTAYAVHLGLGWVDPARARSSLDFKLSTRRDGSDLQIVQDTGTGGSYPVSTDRSVWAFGAREVLQHLTGEARAAFRDRAFTAIKNTIDHDRVVVFDPRDGLYRGEQSFLDWREQTYPGWAVPDLAHIAASKSLSTNVAHLALFDTGVELAKERGDTASATAIEAMATALRSAIRARLWLDEDKQLSTYVTTELDPAPSRRADLLGLSLAILTGAIEGEQAKEALSRYPTLPAGPPVVFPQQKETPVYHNRAIWPFVTAYWVKAAKKVGNDAAFDAGVRSLMRGAALNLSNMENLEVVTGTHFLEDGAYSGPVVNSQRQLWSVAGYIGLVNGAIFGVEAQPGGVRVAPFVTRGLRRTLFANADSLVLNNLPLRGKTMSIVIRLPAKSEGGGAYAVARVLVNGVVASDGNVSDASLGERNTIEVELGEPGPAAVVRTITDVSDYRTIFAPRTPSVSSIGLDGSNRVAIGVDVSGEASADVTVSVYRDGVRVAKDLPGDTTSWSDATTTPSSPSHCYTLETRYVGSGNVSQRANPQCFWGSGGARITSLPASGFTVTGGAAVNAHGRFFYEGWGDPTHQIVATFDATRTGAHLVQAVYGNGAGAISTGITCAVKKVTVEELPGGAVVGTGYIVMPQRGDWASWGDSTMVRVNLSAGKSYRVRLSADAHSVNMSAFTHFADYTGGTGGTAGAFAHVNVAELKVLSLAP
ncbi:MAG: hypothetical protein KF819_04190 [Labilithrix sp.]|nr:hypothetical protein [Labilithrix sp.]